MGSKIRREICTRKKDSGLWCNGNTTDSGPVFPGSNPGSPTATVSVASVFCGRLDYGVMVTQQILVLFFQVRILVVQHEAFLISGKAFFCARWLVPGRCENGILFPHRDFSKKLLHLSGLIVSLLKTSSLCPEGCTGHLSAEGVCIPYGRRERLFLKRFFFCAKRFFNLSQAIFRSAPNDFPLSADRFPVFILKEGWKMDVLSFSYCTYWNTVCYRSGWKMKPFFWKLLGEGDTGARQGVGGDRILWCGYVLLTLVR